MSKKLQGKVALVTGGSTGIGFATAREFVAEGAHVYITGRCQVELDEAVMKIGSSVVGFQADAGNLLDLDRLYSKIQDERGRLASPLGSITEQQYSFTFDTNVKGLIFTVQKALPLLANGASVILNASTSASQVISTRLAQRRGKCRPPTCGVDPLS